jgi:cell division control protein 6
MTPAGREVSGDHVLDQDGVRVSDLFEQTRDRAGRSVFLRKALLDPTAYGIPVRGRTAQAEQLVGFLADVERGYLPAMIQVYGSTGTGKTSLVRQVVDEAIRQFPRLRAVYVNLKESRSLFAAGNQILGALAGEKACPVAGLDGVFERIWACTAGVEYLLLVLDEFDAIFQSRRYNPSDFLYTLVRRREAHKPPVVGLVTISNALLGVDARLDSRVRSSVGTQSVYFPPYKEAEIRTILRDRAVAFRSGTLPNEVVVACARLAADEHGDARRAVDLVRTAGEVADGEGASVVLREHVDRAQEELEASRARQVVWDLPPQEEAVLYALCLSEVPGSGGITAEALYAAYLEQAEFWRLPGKGRRRFLDFLGNLEMHGLVASRVESHGRRGRQKVVWLEVDAYEIFPAVYGHLQPKYRPDLLPLFERGSDRVRLKPARGCGGRPDTGRRS